MDAFGTGGSFGFQDQKVKVQGEGGIKCAGNNTLKAEAYRT